MGVGEARQFVVLNYGQDVHDALNPTPEPIPVVPEPVLFDVRLERAKAFLRSDEARKMNQDDVARTVFERFGKDVKESFLSPPDPSVPRKPWVPSCRAELRLPSRAIQIQTVMVPANYDDHVEEGVRIIALCEDGSMWVRYTDFVIETLRQTCWYMLEMRSSQSW
jgi:hypothetical protein